MDYTRKKSVITCLDPKTSKNYVSINAAKRESRRLQGNGHTVKVIKETPQ